MILGVEHGVGLRWSMGRGNFFEIPVALHGRVPGSFHLGFRAELWPHFGLPF